MKRITVVFLSITLLLASATVRADEGMWLLSLVQKLNMEKMKSMGLELDAEDIYSVNHSSLKDAVVALDYGSCTAELISGKGLLLTNHHCGYGEIQEHSSVEHDYLKNGFWAKSFDQELPNPGKTATFLVSMREVTEDVLAGVSADMPQMAFQAKVGQAAKKIEQENADPDKHIEARVASMFNGNRFFLFLTKTYKDVRLVGAPPSSIGKFGGDTDNWMWPRHTGDFSIFRIYAGPDGEPAEYSEDNIPLENEKFLPISLKGIEKGDFAMVLGFPGSTDRYMSSWGVQQTMDITNTIRVKARTKKQEIMKDAMRNSDKIRIQYASKYSRSANYWKYSIGQNKQLKALGVVEEKQALEAKLSNWIAANAQRKEKYGDALSMLEESYNALEEFQVLYSYFIETVYSGAEIYRLGMRTNSLLSALDKDDKEAIEEATESLKSYLPNFYNDYHKPLDKKLFVATMNMYRDNLDKKFHPGFFSAVEEEYEGSFENYADYVYSETILVDEKAFMKFLKRPKLRKISDDPGIKIMKDMRQTFGMQQQINYSSIMKQEKGKRLFVAALIKMQEDQTHYPDANSTMRFTYGTVGDYEPRDGVLYKYYTTLEGVMEKEDPDDEEFVVDKKLKTLYKNKDFGRYGQDGIMPVCFLTDNDITGGNSGSPVINGKGHIIGTAFDGNWEAMSGDIKFEDELQKCINVDIRYTLFVIDKFAGATRLIEEMKIIE